VRKINVFELFAKLGLDTDGFQKGLSKAGGALKTFGGTIGSSMAKFASVTNKALGVATVAAGGAVAKLTKDATSAYANYQQLAGGIEKLFGDSADIVMQYADNAYMDAAVSANEYMEQVSSFSASLIKSLGGDTKKAAELANTALKSMSDNANTFGSDIATLQSAYQAFAKNNYTLLDNLRLGYGGTASEMAKLVNDSGVLGGTMEATAKNINEVGFDKIIEAIDVIQGRMGIADTTAKEAAGTISGSLGAVKAAWENVVTAMGDKNGDIEGNIQKLSQSVAAFGKNILPTIQTALSGVVTLIENLAPEIIKAIPGLAQKIIPQLTSTIGKLVPVLVSSFRDLIQTLAKQIPTLLPTLLNAWVQIYTALIDSLDILLDELIPMLPQIIDTISNFLLENAPKLVESGLKLLTAILEGISQNIDKIVDTIAKLIPIIAETIIDNLPKILEAGGRIISKLAKGIAEHLPEIIRAIADVIGALLVEIGTHLPEILEAGWDIIKELGKGLAKTFEPISNAISDLFVSIGSWFDEKIDFIKGYGKYLIDWLGDGIGGAIDTVKTKVGEIWNTIKNFFTEKYNDAVELGEKIIEGIVSGFTTMWDTLKGAVTDDFWDNWQSGMRSILGINSPSKVAAREIGSPIAEGIGYGFEKEIANVNKMMQDGVDADFNVDTTVRNTASTNETGRTSAAQQAQVITMRLVDGSGRIIAETVTPDVNQLQGALLSFGERGLAT
jgi:phage-related protein